MENRIPSDRTSVHCFSPDAADGIEDDRRESDDATAAARRSAASPLANPVDAAQAPAAPCVQRASILLVNDNPGVLFALRVVLSDLDVDVVTADSGEHALLRLLRHDFSLILLDVKMGGMDGFETARAIRQRPCSLTTPIMFLTSHRVTDQDRDAGLALGALDYLFMPMAPEVLKAKVQVVLDASRVSCAPENKGARAQLPQAPLAEWSRAASLPLAGATILETSGAEHLIVEHTADFVAMLDASCCWLYAGTSYRTEFGSAVFLGGSYLDIVDPEDRDRVRACLQSAGSPAPGQRLRYRVLAETERHLESDVKRVPDSDGRMRLVVISRDVTERKEIEAYLLHEAFHDNLTGLPNRLLLRDRLAQALASRERAHPAIALLFIDLDGFKYINDTLGHSCGDRVLQDVAERLLRCVREGDTVARLGGDEFVVMLPDVRIIEDAAVVAAKIVETLSANCQIDGSALHVPPSIGIAVFPDDGDDVDALLRSADTAMYHAKRDGGARFCFFAARMQDAAAHKLMLSKAMQRGIDQNGFRLHFQPQIDAVSGAILGFEALMRWPENEGAAISPSVFIPLAEETGRIEHLGNWAIDQALAQLKCLHDHGFPNITIAINVSAIQFRRGTLAASLESSVRRAGVDCSLIEVELTESAAMSDPFSAIEMLQQIHALGIRISIDDFGTGYSSLSYLKELPIDKLKIDASFVRDIGASGTETKAGAIVQAIITLAHVLKLTVIAEGVETVEQATFLRDHGCDQLQGHLFDAAVPPDAMLALLQHGPYPLSCLPRSPLHEHSPL